MALQLLPYCLSPSTPHAYPLPYTLPPPSQAISYLAEEHDAVATSLELLQQAVQDLCTEAAGRGREGGLR